MKKRMISIGEILISLGLIPLWFVKFFHGVGHLPSQSDPNTIVQVDFYHSMYENINADFEFMFPVSMALVALSVIFSAVCLKFASNKKMQTTLAFYVHPSLEQKRAQMEKLAPVSSSFK